MSVTVGGVAYQESRLLLVTGAYEFGRFAVSADVTQDQVAEPRDGEAEDFYRLQAASLTGRLYTRAPGRGFFAETGLAYARARLRSTDAAGVERTSSGALPMLTYGGGVRLGRTRGGVFAELGLRSALFLRETHLYVDDAPREGSRDEPLTDGSWFFGRGRRSAQAYVGLGYSF